MKKDPGNTLRKSQKINLGNSAFTLRDKVDDQDKDDLFRFRTRSSFELSIDLSKLRGDADIELYSLKRKRGQVFKDIGKVDFDTMRRKDIRRNLERVARSRNKGRDSESIQERIEPGQYYLRILSKKGESAKYRLQVSATEPTFEQVWINQFGSAENDQMFAIALDNAGQNVYIAGATNGIFLESIQNPAKTSDAFVAKYTPDGNVAWFRPSGGEGRDGILHLKLDNQGNIYGLGNTGYTPPIGIAPPQGSPYFVRYDDNGSLLFETTLGGPEYEAEMGLSIDSSGNIFAHTQRESLAANLVVENAQLVYQYTPSNGVQFQRNLDVFSQTLFDISQPYPSPTEAFADKAGNVYLIGVITGFQTASVARVESIFDGLVSKYDASGRLLWQNTISSPETDIVRKITVDNEGNVYVVGTTLGSLPGNSNQGQDDAFLAKYSADGTPLWTQQLGSSGSEAATDVAVDSNGNVYVIGITTDDLFGHTNLGEQDVWLAQFDANGIILDSTRIGTSAEDLSAQLTIDANGDIYVTGITKGDLGGVNQGGFDAWIAKYTPPV